MIGADKEPGLAASLSDLHATMTTRVSVGSHFSLLIPGHNQRLTGSNFSPKKLPVSGIAAEGQNGTGSFLSSSIS